MPPKSAVFVRFQLFFISFPLGPLTSVEPGVCVRGFLVISRINQTKPTAYYINPTPPINRTKTAMRPIALPFIESSCSSASAIVNFLHQVHIQAFAELFANFLHDSDILESLRLEKIDAPLVALSYPGNDRVKTCLLAFLHDFLEKLPANSASLVLFLDIKRNFCGLGVCASIRPFTQRCPADNESFQLCDYQGMFLVMFLRPSLHFLGSLWFSVKCGNSLENSFVIN